MDAAAAAGACGVSAQPAPERQGARLRRLGGGSVREESEAAAALRLRAVAACQARRQCRLAGRWQHGEAHVARQAEGTGIAQLDAGLAQGCRARRIRDIGAGAEVIGDAGQDGPAQRGAQGLLLALPVAQPVAAARQASPAFRAASRPRAAPRHARPGARRARVASGAGPSRPLPTGRSHRPRARRSGPGPCSASTVARRGPSAPRSSPGGPRGAAVHRPGRARRGSCRASASTRAPKPGWAWPSGLDGSQHQASALPAGASGSRRTSRPQAAAARP